MKMITHTGTGNIYTILIQTDCLKFEYTASICSTARLFGNIDSILHTRKD